MAQYEFTGSNTGQQTASANSGTIVYYTYLTVTLNQADFLRHLDYDISWHSQGFSSVCTYCPSEYSCVKINLYDNTGTFIQTLETIYEYNVNNGGSYYNYTGSLDFNEPIQSGYEIRVVLQARYSGWTSYVNAASITAVTGPLCETLIFEDDFQTSPISPEWSTTSGVLPALFSYLSNQVFGPFGNKTINLDLSGLPATHSHIRVEFDLYIFDSWDGASHNDDWKLKVDGVDRIHTDFDNHTWQAASQTRQAYPHNVEFSNPRLTGSVQSALPSRCWNSGNSGPQGSCTSLYFINNITQHTNSFLTIGLEALGLQSVCDESWGIDNIKVYALGVNDGCTDSLACNYDSTAICDDGSCAGLWGCMDNTACNYNALATCDDGSCILPDGCTDPAACNYNAIYLCDDGNCVYDVGIPIVTNSCPGMNDGQFTVIADSTHLNYDPSAIYHWGIGSSGLILFNTPISSLSPGFFQYFTIVAGILCTGNTFTISEYAAMTLATTGVANCDSSYAVVSASVAPYSGGTVSTQTYCSSFPAQDAYSNIELVRLVGDGDSIVNNTIGICDDYEDYTALYTTLTAGQTYNMQINLGSCDPVWAFVDAAKIFIDWNIDGDFDDSGEEVQLVGPFQSPSSNTFPFTVPNNATIGATRMRVVAQNYDYNGNSTAFTSCDSTVWFGATEDYSIVISATGTLTNATYQWYSGAGSTTPIVGETDSITNSLAAGQYTVIVTDNNGCERFGTVIVGASAPISVTAGTNQTICYGGTPNNLTAIGTGTGTGSYSWSPPSAFTNPNLQDPVFNNGNNFNTDVTYTVTYTDSISCAATDSVTITVNPQPERPNITASPDSACEGDSITLTAFSSQAICGPASSTACYEVEVEITTDINGNEISWDITDNTGAVVASGGPYTNGVVSTYTITACLPSGVQLYFNWYDSAGNGWNAVSQGIYSVMQGTATITQGSPSSGFGSFSVLGAVSSGTTPICTSPLMSYEYKFEYNDGSGWNGNNVTTPSWGINNPVIYNNITQSTAFRVKIREGPGCTGSQWGGPTNQGITVPVNITPITGSIWHN
jgi:hypothetical protein